MKIEYLEEFIVFARHLSFSRAAEELYISQPTLSTHIRSIEREIGFDLVQRNNRPSLTPAGLVFLGRCQEIVEKYYQAIAEARMAATSSPPARILDNERSFELHRLAAMVKNVPYVLVDAEETISIWQAFSQDRVDFGLILDYTNDADLVRQAEEKNIEAIRVGVARMGICVMKDHPLAKKEKLTKEDLYAYSIGITSSAYYVFLKQIINGLIKPDRPLKFRLDPVDNTANLSFMDFSDGLYFFVLDVVNTFIAGRDDIVIFREIEGKPIEGFSVIIYATDNPNPNVALFAKSLRAVVEDPDYPGLPHP